MENAALRTLVKEVLNETLDERNRIDAEKHAEHHRWLDEWIERRRAQGQRRAERWDKIHASVLGAIITTVVLGVLTGLYNVGAYVLKHWKG